MQHVDESGFMESFSRSLHADNPILFKQVFVNQTLCVKLVYLRYINTAFGIYPAYTIQYDAIANAIGHIMKVAMHHTAALP